jgi:DNA-binding response OmpR family regulator
MLRVVGHKTAIDTRMVDTHLGRLREKLGMAADRIVTMRGEGYRFFVHQHVA